jgi:di/tricarboxylate transporter
MKVLVLSIAVFDGFFCSATIKLLQIVPSSQKISDANSLDAYLISAIIALVGTISFLFIYSKSLNKIIKSMGEANAKQLQKCTRNKLKIIKK